MHVCNDPAHARLARNVEKVKQKLADTSKLIALYNDAKAQLGSQGQQLAALRAERARLEKERAEHSDERTRLERVNRELEQRRCDDEKTQLRRVQEKEKEIQQQKGEVERVRREGEKLQEQLAAKTRALQQLQADGGGGGRPAPPALLVASPAPAAAPLLASPGAAVRRLETELEEARRALRDESEKRRAAEERCAAAEAQLSQQRGGGSTSGLHPAPAAGAAAGAAEAQRLRKELESARGRATAAERRTTQAEAAAQQAARERDAARAGATRAAAQAATAASAAAAASQGTKRARDDDDGGSSEGGDAIAALVDRVLNDVVIDGGSDAALAHTLDQAERLVGAWAHPVATHAQQPCCVAIELSGAGTAALDALVRRLIRTRPPDWVHDLISALAERIVGDGRGAPLDVDAMRTMVLRCQLHARLCRDRGERARVRVLGFEILRHRRYAEPALIAALCCGWPAPWQLARLPDTRNGSPLLAAIAARLLRVGVGGGAATERRACQHALALLADHAGGGWAERDVAAVRDAEAAVEDALVAGLGGGDGEGGGFECRRGLELFAAARGWAWTAKRLLGERLRAPLSGGGAAVVGALELIGELASLEPAADDPARQWVVAQLSGVLGQTEAERSVDERAAASRALDLWSALG